MRRMPALLLAFLIITFPAIAAVAPVPEVEQAARDRIASISDEDLAKFREAMTKDPSKGSEVLAGMLPPEMRSELARISDVFLTKADDAIKEREAISTLVTLTRILPPEQLQRLGIDAVALQKLDATFQGLSPVELTVLHAKTSSAADWQESRARALEAMPESVRAGSAALAEHGLLTVDDRIALDEFRLEVSALMRRIDALPPSLQTRLQLQDVRFLAQRIQMATPEVLFMIRSELKKDDLATIEKSVEFLESVASMSPEEMEELESFRAELREALAISPQDRNQIETLRPDQLVALRASIGSSPEWQTVMPAVAGTLRDPSLQQRITAADPVAMETFRADAISFVQAAQMEGTIAPDIAARSLTILKNANTPQLAVIQAAAAGLGETASSGALASVPLAVASSVTLDCVIDFIIPVVEEKISIDLNWLCQPLEDAINAVAGVVDDIVAGITKVVDDIWNFVTTIPEKAVKALTDAFKALLDIEIANGVSLLDIVGAQNVGAALTSMLQLLGMNDTSMPWLTSLSSALGTMPMLPCPDIDVVTPFGKVGDWEATKNHARYQFFVEEVLEIIPETEISLVVKIPLQVLFMGFKYLGVCLEYASDTTAYDHYEAHWKTNHDAATGLATQLGTAQQLLGNQIVTTGSGLNSAITNAKATLSGELSSEGNSTRSKVQAESETTRGKVKDESDSTRSKVVEESDSTRTKVQAESDSTRSKVKEESDSTRSKVEDEGKSVRSELDIESQAIQEKIDALKLSMSTSFDGQAEDLEEKFDTTWDLQLRLAIEANLLAGEGNEMAVFQLPAPHGYLEVVRDLVRQTIQAMSATGQKVNQAAKFFAQGEALMLIGKYKEAYKEFQKAYRDAVK